MERSYYLKLASEGLRMPVGTHLVLHSHADHAKIEFDGPRLGAVFAETAKRFNTPMAIPLMDLTLEKAALLQLVGVPAADAAAYHFHDLESTPDPKTLGTIPVIPRMQATCEAITHVSKTPGLLPIGMCIGPFSLMTKLISDPIMPVYLAGTGLTGEDEPDVALVERLLELGEKVIHPYIRSQIAAGAKAIFVCEPAANLVYFSPKQQEETNYTVFERFVMEPMRRIAALLREHNVDMIFHDCGELTPEMVRRFGTLDAAMMSLGCSRKLWEDAPLVPKTTVLYGNLPSKQFYAPHLTTAEVARQSRELLEKMRATGHPFVLGTECDVLSVPGSEKEIMSKVDAMMNA